MILWPLMNVWIPLFMLTSWPTMENKGIHDILHDLYKFIVSFLDTTGWLLSFSFFVISLFVKQLTIANVNAFIIFGPTHLCPKGAAAKYQWLGTRIVLKSKGKTFLRRCIQFEKMHTIFDSDNLDLTWQFSPFWFHLVDCLLVFLVGSCG